MRPVYFAAARRTPIGRLRGALSAIRADDLAARALSGVLADLPGLDPATIDDVYWGAANQAGEDNRNVARMAVLLAGLPETVPGATAQPALRVRDGGGDQRGPGDRRRRRRRRAWPAAPSR